MNTQGLLTRLESAWSEFTESYAGLTDAQMTGEPVTGAWTVKDVIAHVTWWEEEALEHLPVVASGGRPPRYSVRYGGIDAFNSLRTDERRALSLGAVLQQAREAHARLLDYLSRVPEDLLATDTRFRRRLRLDTYGHYPLHARAIREWRERIETPRAGNGRAIPDDSRPQTE